MSVLAELLGAPEPAFRQAITKLEQACGAPSADVRLAAGIMQNSQAAVKSLGLDPQDTTARELYRALMLKVGQDEKHLRRRLGLKDKTTLDELVPTVVKALTDLQIPRAAWVIKPSVAKRFIKTNPPKTLMKQLGYRSIDSLLKREPVAAILMGGFMTEGTTWRERLYTKYRQLKPSDCEMADVSVVILKAKRWQQFFMRYANLRRQLIVPVAELGALVVLPLEATVLPGAALALLLSLVYRLNHVRSLSAHVKLQQVKPQFGQRALDIWHGRAKPNAYMAEQPLYWGAVHRHYAQRPADDFPETFDPHIQPEDLHQHTPEEVLLVVDPALGFWQQSSHSGMSHNGEPVSLHALDAAINYCNQLPFEQRSTSYVQEALGHELLVRYLRQPHMHRHVKQQLETQPTVPEALGSRP